MEFVKRPVAVFTMSLFVFFCAITNFFGKPGAVFLTVSGALLASFLILRFVLRGKKRVFFGYLSLATAGILAAAVFASALFYPSISKYDSLAGQTHSLTGTVREELWSSNGSNCYALDVSGVDGEKQSFGAALIVSSYHEKGDVVKAKCDVSKITTDSFDYEKYYLSRGLILTASSDYAVKTGESSSVRTFFSKLNDNLSSVLEKNLSKESASVAEAVLLGNRVHLSDRTTSSLSRLGVSHLIAISGMHVSFICFALTLILRRLRVGKRKIALVTIAAMIYYMFLTGFSPSVTRAVFICVAACVVAVLGISFDVISALSVCGAVMVAVDPYVSFSAAMQLSFASCAGCFAAVQLLKKLGLWERRTDIGFFARFVRRIIKIFISTVTIVIFSLPVTLMYYDTVSLFAPFANLIFIPAFSVILYLSSLVLIFSPVAPLCGAVSFVAEKFIGAVLRAADAASSVKGVGVSLKYPFSPYIIAVSCVSLILIVLGRKRLAKAASVCLASCILFYGVGIAIYNASCPTASLARTGNAWGEAAVVSSDGKTVLIDLSGGNRSAVRTGVGALDELCETELDYYVILRCTTLQVGEVRRLAETERLSAVYINRDGADDAAYDRIISILDENGVEARDLPLMPDALNVGDATFSFVRPASGAKSAVCFKVGGNSTSAVYLGSGWADVSPNVVATLGDFDSAIFGSSGKTPSAAYDPTYFDNCKTYSFVDGNCVRGLSGVEFPDISSTFVLNID